MNKYIIIFVIVIIILFGGIALLIKPGYFAKSVSISSARLSGESAHNNMILRTIATLGSVLTITGTVGLAVLGFIMFKQQK